MTVIFSTSSMYDYNVNTPSYSNSDDTLSILLIGASRPGHTWVISNHAYSYITRTGHEDPLYSICVLMYTQTYI